MLRYEVSIWLLLVTELVAQYKGPCTEAIMKAAAIKILSFLCVLCLEGRYNG